MTNLLSGIMIALHNNFKTSTGTIYQRNPLIVNCISLNHLNELPMISRVMTLHMRSQFTYDTVFQSFLFTRYTAMKLLACLTLSLAMHSTHLFAETADLKAKQLFQEMVSTTSDPSLVKNIDNLISQLHKSKDKEIRSNAVYLSQISRYQIIQENNQKPLFAKLAKNKTLTKSDQLVISSLMLSYMRTSIRGISMKNATKEDRIAVEKATNQLKYISTLIDDLKSPNLLNQQPSKVTKILTLLHGISAIQSGLKHKDGAQLTDGARDLTTIFQMLSTRTAVASAPVAAFMDMPAESVVAIQKVNVEGLNLASTVLRDLAKAMEGDQEALARMLKNAQRMESVLSAERYGKALQNAMISRVVDKIPYLRSIYTLFSTQQVSLTKRNFVSKAAFGKRIAGNWDVDWTAISPKVTKHPSIGGVAFSVDHETFCEKDIEGFCYWRSAPKYATYKNTNLFTGKNAKSSYSHASISYGLGMISIKWPYYILGHWGGKSTLEFRDNDHISGGWAYGDERNAENWVRAKTTIDSVTVHSDNKVISQVRYGEESNCLEINHTWQNKRYGEMRGNRPHFRVDILGKNLWGYHNIQLGHERGLEALGYTYLYGKKGTSEESTIVGISFNIVVWPGFYHGAKDLILDGQVIPLNVLEIKADKKRQLRCNAS